MSGRSAKTNQMLAYTMDGRREVYSMSSKLLQTEAAMNEEQPSLAKAIASKAMKIKTCIAMPSPIAASSPSEILSLAAWASTDVSSGSQLRPTSLVLWYRDSLSSLQKSSTGPMTGPISQPGGT
jgi:hypothetical protein